MNPLCMYTAGMWGMLAVIAIYEREPIKSVLTGSVSGALAALALL